jgi:hypothetical protein
MVGFAPGRGVSLALVSNRLVTPGIPIPTDTLWQQLRSAASVALDEAHDEAWSKARE